MFNKTDGQHEELSYTVMSCVHVCHTGVGISLSAAVHGSGSEFLCVALDQLRDHLCFKLPL